MLYYTAICTLALLFITAMAFNSAPRVIKSRSIGSRSDLTMKGKGGKVPVNQRGEYMKQQRMMDQKAQMEMGKKEGVPVFKVFVRPRAGGLWIPCGDLAGDERATALVNAYMSGFMTDMYKTQIRQGIAKSVFSQEDAFVNGLIENYKPFRKFTKSDLQFGFKVDYEGLEEKMESRRLKPLSPAWKRIGATTFVRASAACSETTRNLLFVLVSYAPFHTMCKILQFDTNYFVVDGRE